MTIVTGIMPVAPTAFDDDQQLDHASQRRVMDFLVDAQVDGICIMANYSEQFSLSDDERTAVIDTALAQVSGRVPVCVATSHYSAFVANQRNREAQERGAAMVMMMPPFYGAGLSVDESALLPYFRIALEGISIPLMLQALPDEHHADVGANSGRVLGTPASHAALREDRDRPVRGEAPRDSRRRREPIYQASSTVRRPSR